MLYNDSISYNQPGVLFTGTLQINVPGISLPLLINNIGIYFLNSIDHSNATTLGIISVNYVSTGLVVIEATQEQAEAISQSNIISLNTGSTATIESIANYSGSTAEVYVVSNLNNSQVSLEY